MRGRCHQGQICQESGCFQHHYVIAGEADKAYPGTVEEQEYMKNLVPTRLIDEILESVQ